MREQLKAEVLLDSYQAIAMCRWGVLKGARASLEMGRRRMRRAMFVWS